MPNSFDLRLQRARDEINEALGQRMTNLGPPPNQQQMQLPGNPQVTPQGLAFSGQKQIGPGALSGGAMVGPQGFGGASANYSAPVAGGNLNVGAAVDPRMQLSQMQAQYQRGPFSAGLQYQPGAGVSGGVQYRQPFKEGGGVWTRKEGQNPEGGLNAKGRASLKAQGQDIKPPVSAKQAAKSPKAAGRRKSFCARSAGQAKMFPNAARDPDSRLNKARRKWDC
jgi:hypothetical protein